MGNLCSAFNHPKCTHTHTVYKNPEQWAAIYAATPGEQLWVRCLAQGHLVVVLKVERALDNHSPHLQFLPAREIRPRLKATLVSLRDFFKLNEILHFEPWYKRVQVLQVNPSPLEVISSLAPSQTFSLS